MNRSHFESTYRIVVSIFVCFVLLFQLVVSLGPIVNIELGTRFWPIVNYAMYSKSYREGDTVDVYKILEAVTEQGATVPVSMETVGMHIFHFRDLVKDLQSENQDAIDFVLDSVETTTPITLIRIKSFPVVVTRDGPQEKPSEILGEIHVTDDRGVRQ